MKRCINLLFILGIMCTGTLTQAQGVNETYTKSLKEVLTAVENKFNVKLFYPEEMAKNKKVDYAMWRYTSEFGSTMDNILKPLGLDYYYEPGLKKYRVVNYEYYRRPREEGKKDLDSLLKMYTNAEQFDKRRKELKVCIQNALGIDMSANRIPLNAIIRPKQVMNGYTVENVAFESFPGYFVTGTLYRPVKGKGPFPVIISPHGHFYGEEGPNYEDGNGRYNPDVQYRCATLAKMGAIVFNYDMYSWGESALQTGKASLHHTLIAGPIQTWNSSRAIDFLLSLPGADKKRVGVTGASGGGTQTMLVAALDGRVTASAPVVMVSASFFGGCECETGLPVHGECNGRRTNNPEIASMMAPLPQIVISDGLDWTKDVPEIEFPYMQKVYGFYGKASNVENVHLPNDDHDYGISKRTPVYKFFAKVFSLNLPGVLAKDGSIDESGVTIQKSKDMKVFGTQPLPANALKDHESIIKSFRQQFPLTSTTIDQGVEIRENNKKVLFYQFQPKSLNGNFERAGYIHPLYGFNENILTEDMPADHPHHHGIFWAWHQIIWKNKWVGDGWTSEKISYEPVKLEIEKGSNQLVLKSELDWKAKPESGNITTLIKEHTNITVFKSTSQYRIVDFSIKLSALEDSVKIGGSVDGKGYGGFSVRLNLPKDISFISTDSAVNPQKNSVLSGPWMNFTGSFDGNTKSAIALFCGYPVSDNKNQAWILRSAESMQNAKYPGGEPIELTKKGITFKYRLVIQEKEMSQKDLQKLYEEYMHHI